MNYTIAYVVEGKLMCVALFFDDELCGIGFSPIGVAYPGAPNIGGFSSMMTTLHLICAGMDDRKLGIPLSREDPEWIASPCADALLVGEGDSVLTWVTDTYSVGE